jgi:hypothetical protein
MAWCKYPGYETGKGWRLKPGSLDLIFWRRFQEILGASPPIFAYVSTPESPLKNHCSIVNP